MGKPLKALKFFDIANKAVPNRWEIAKQIGLTYLSFEKHEKAVACLVESLAENTGDFAYHPEPKNDSDTWDKIGFCFFQLKKWNQAKTAWERAIEIGTDKIQNQLNKKRIELLAREYGV